MASPRPMVGIPKHETVLHDALKQQFGMLFPPGSGRSTFIIPEPDLGFGRPDALLVTIAPRGLEAFRNQNLRLSSLNAAKSIIGFPGNLSGSYSRALVKDLERAGWTDKALIAAGQLIHDSLAVEAKLNDWRRAIRQASAYRVGAGRASILVPVRVSKLVNPRNLDIHQIGLLADNGQEIAWRLDAPRANISISHRAWLLELLLRGIEDGSAQRATCSLNNAKASR